MMYTIEVTERKLTTTEHTRAKNVPLSRSNMYSIIGIITTLYTNGCSGQNNTTTMLQ